MAQLHLGSCYSTGRGVSQDLWTAHNLLLAASKQGSGESDTALKALTNDLMAHAAKTFAVNNDPRFSDNDALRLVANSVAMYRLKYPTYGECQKLQSTCCALLKAEMPHDVLAAVQGSWYIFSRDISMFKQGLYRYGPQWETKAELNQILAAVDNRAREMVEYQVRKRHREQTAQNDVVHTTETCQFCGGRGYLYGLRRADGSYPHILCAKCGGRAAGMSGSGSSAGGVTTGTYAPGTPEYEDYMRRTGGGRYSSSVGAGEFSKILGY